MQPKPFAGPKLKIARGREHVAELDAKVAAYLQDDSWAMLLQLEKNTGQHRIALKGRKEIPGEFSTIFGDAVHNFRTALDILANDLVALSGVQPNKVYFPFGKDAIGFEDELKSKMGQAPADIQAIVRSFKPYSGVLRAMHDLDIADKHVAVVSVAASGLTGSLPMRRTKAESLPQGGGRLTYEADFGALKTVPINLIGFPADAEPNIETIGKIAGSELDCAIHKGLPLAREPVVKALRQMGDLTESIIQTFEAHCFGVKKPTE
jgi:hypothetical protein